jgi:hypothetical protein
MTTTHNGTGSSDLVEPDFGSLIVGIHHMHDLVVSDSKLGYLNLEDPASHTMELSSSFLPCGNQQEDQCRVE